jgi:hypothetical protein
MGTLTCRLQEWRRRPRAAPWRARKRPLRAARTLFAASSFRSLTKSQRVSGGTVRRGAGNHLGADADEKSRRRLCIMGGAHQPAKGPRDQTDPRVRRENLWMTARAPAPTASCVANSPSRRRLPVGQERSSAGLSANATRWNRQVSPPNGAPFGIRGGGEAWIRRWQVGLALSLLNV